MAVDIDPVACAFARHNAARAGLDVDVREGPMERVLAAEESFALVTADPPWVPRAETGRFPEDPLLAIDGGDDGLDLARLCLTVADAHLAEEGSVLLQLGTEDQVSEIAAWASEQVRLRVTDSRPHGAVRWRRGAAGPRALGAVARRDDLVGAVAPGRGRGLPAAAHRAHRTRGPVRDPLLVLHHVLAPQQQRTARTDDDVGVVGVVDAVMPPTPRACGGRPGPRGRDS